MTPWFPTSPVSPAGVTTPTSPRRTDRGAVLRDVAVHHEPRVLVTPKPRASGASESLPSPVDFLEAGRSSGDGLDGTSALLPGADAYRAQAETTVAYQVGYKAGRADTESELQAAREDALQAGFREGLERGLVEGRERGLQEGREAGEYSVKREARAGQDAVVERLALIDCLLAELPVEFGRRLAGAEEEMVALSHAVVCRILGEKLVTREGVAQCVAQAVREAGGGASLPASDRQPVSVHVHPDALATLQGDPVVGAWLRGGEPVGAAPIRLVADERVVLGGCLVRSSEGTLDARIEVQMEALRQLLLEARSFDSTPSPGEG